MYCNFWGIVLELLRFIYYGEIYQRVDMRVEVGLMMWNIYIICEVVEV